MGPGTAPRNNCLQSLGPKGPLPQQPLSPSWSEAGARACIGSFVGGGACRGLSTAAAAMNILDSVRPLGGLRIPRISRVPALADQTQDCPRVPA